MKPEKFEIFIAWVNLCQQGRRINCNTKSQEKEKDSHDRSSFTEENKNIRNPRSHLNQPRVGRLLV